jgi:hypothetical protein
MALGVGGLAIVPTSRSYYSAMAGLSFSRLDGIAATSRGLLLDAQKGFAFVVDTRSAKEFALAHWLVGQREFAAEVSWDLPNLAPGATSLVDVTVTGCRQGDLAEAALASSTRFIEPDAAAWTTNTVRVMARNISPSATFDLSPATLSVQVTKRRVP